MPPLLEARQSLACCEVRSSLVVIGGSGNDGVPCASVEMLPPEGAEFASLPPLSGGNIRFTSALRVEESSSAHGQVLLRGGLTYWDGWEVASQGVYSAGVHN